MNSKNMKTITQTSLALLCTATFATQAGTFSNNFNAGLPAGMTLYGTANVQPSGGFTNSGYLELTTAASGGSASAILGDLDAGVPIVSFTASFKLWLGTPFYNIADGFSFNFAPDLPAGAISEEGAGTGYTIEFDT